MNYNFYAIGCVIYLIIEFSTTNYFIMAACSLSWL